MWRTPRVRAPAPTRPTTTQHAQKTQMAMARDARGRDDLGPQTVQARLPTQAVRGLSQLDMCLLCRLPMGNQFRYRAPALEPTPYSPRTTPLVLSGRSLSRLSWAISTHWGGSSDTDFSQLAKRSFIYVQVIREGANTGPRRR
jgi:hypothetical protein